MKKLGLYLFALTLLPAADLLDRVPARAAARINPLDNADQSRRAGAKLFERECAACHGQDAAGIGKAPALRSPGVAQAAPGTLFWILKNGSIYRGMPSFAHLPEPQRWQIVTFLKSL